MGLLESAVVICCATCKWNKNNFCPLEIEQVDKYRCRNYLPTVRIDLRLNYKGEYEL
jgi:hypothetical protein